MNNSSAITKTTILVSNPQMKKGQLSEITGAKRVSCQNNPTCLRIGGRINVFTVLQSTLHAVVMRDLII